MIGDEGFLARWSRRKRRIAARREPRRPTPAVESAAPPEPVAPVDPATLPPLESIGPGSDIRAFLAVGVPPDLTRAALRRAWRADPAIRDFIGLAENAWDFTAEGGAPGFGALTAEDLRVLLGEGGSRGPDNLAPASVVSQSGISAAPASLADHAAPNTKSSTSEPSVAAQHKSEAEPDTNAPSTRRSHGSALPR